MKHNIPPEDDLLVVSPCLPEQRLKMTGEDWTQEKAKAFFAEVEKQDPGLEKFRDTLDQCAEEFGLTLGTIDQLLPAYVLHGDYHSLMKANIRLNLDYTAELMTAGHLYDTLNGTSNPPAETPIIH